MSLWKSSDLALAIDPTTLSDRLCAIVASVVCRGCAIPAARVVMPANKKGKWIDPTVKPLDSLSVAIPKSMRAIAMSDRGLRSPKPWKKIHKLGWHPYMRQRVNTTFRLAGGMRMPVKGTIIVIWVEGQDEPWIILTDLPPKEAGASWREMRFWIETGFKALKSVGWQWRKTRRTDPARVERHWLVLSVATPLTFATGSRAEDAQAMKRDPSALRAAPKAAPERNRLASVFRLGLSTLSRLLTNGRMRRRARLLPEPWPPPPDGVKVVCHTEIQNLPLQAREGRRGSAGGDLYLISGAGSAGVSPAEPRLRALHPRPSLSHKGLTALHFFSPPLIWSAISARMGFADDSITGSEIESVQA